MYVIPLGIPFNKLRSLNEMINSIFNLHKIVLEGRDVNRGGIHSIPNKIRRGEP